MAWEDYSGTPAETGTTTPDQKFCVPYFVGDDADAIKEELSPGGNQTVVRCTIRASDRNQFEDEMLGYSYITADKKLARVLPEKCPYGDTSPDVIPQFATRADRILSLRYGKREEFTDPALRNWPEFDEIVFGVTFASPLYDIKEDDEISTITQDAESWPNEFERYCVVSHKGAVKNEKIPGGSYKIIDTDVSKRKQLTEAQVRTGITVGLSVKWIEVPRIDITVLKGLQGKINKYAMTIDGVEYAAKTLLFETWGGTPRRNSRGQKMFDIDFSLMARMDGRTWNHFWTASSTGTPVIVEVSSDGTSGGDRPYTEVDLRKMVTFS